jgi:hypothetical protein
MWQRRRDHPPAARAKRAEDGSLLLFARQTGMPDTSRIISVDRAGRVLSVEATGTHRARRRLHRLAWLLDSSIPIPGTRITIGIDALIGLFPILGDVIGVMLSSYILAEAARLGAPKAVLLRMAFNVGIEGLAGAVPFAGDVFDAAWKANQRNVRLLDAWLERPTTTERVSRWFGRSLVLGVVAFLALLGVAVFLVLRWVIGLM